MDGKLSSWAFASLILCPLVLVASLTLLSGGWAIAGTVIAVILGVLSGGLYGASARSRGPSDERPSAND